MVHHHPLAGRVRKAGRIIAADRVGPDGLPQALSVQFDLPMKVLTCVAAGMCGCTALLSGVLTVSIGLERSGDSVPGAVALGVTTALTLGATVFTAWLAFRQLWFFRRPDGFARVSAPGAMWAKEIRWEDVEELAVYRSGSASQPTTRLGVKLEHERRPRYLYEFPSESTLAQMAVLFATWSGREWAAGQPTRDRPFSLRRN